MAGFEGLIAWQKARELTRNIYQVTAEGEFARDFGLKDQIRRAAVSIMSNIAEGYDRGGRAEFHQFLVIAKGSCAEVRSQLYVAHDIQYLDPSRFERLKHDTQELSRIITGLKKSIQKQRNQK
jgi:four helix bundle protein